MEDSSFWSPRACFAEPPSVLLKAMEQIDEAAFRLLEGGFDEAEQLLRSSDQPEIAAYVDLVQGKVRPEIHRYREVSGAPKLKKVKQRMPTDKQQLELFARDGWRCRFCGLKVVYRKAIKVMNTSFPEAVRWDLPQRQQHPAFRASCASADHIVPHSRGGANDLSNLVTACGPCQFGRNQWLLEEVGILDPRERSAVIDQWDGLTRLLTH